LPRRPTSTLFPYTTLFRSTQTEMLAVPYKGTPQALTDLASGEVDFMFTDFTSGTPFVKAGRLHAMAVSTAERSALLPDLPSMERSEEHTSELQSRENLVCR